MPDKAGIHRGTVAEDSLSLFLSAKKRIIVPHGDGLMFRAELCSLPKGEVPGKAEIRRVTVTED